MTQTWPDASVQGLLVAPKEWWVKTQSPLPKRGRLIWAFIPHVDQTPYEVIPIGRTEPYDHSKFDIKVKPLGVNEPAPTRTLPVAGIPQYPGERLIMQRAKKRPALIISTMGTRVERDLTKGYPKWQTYPHILVGPYYGAGQSEKRGGYAPTLVDRIRLGCYPQFMWDILPFSDEESILRLDHIQPIGVDSRSFELTEYTLSKDALEILDEWLDWFIYDNLDDGLLSWARQELAKYIP